jgi:hypothetical protein
MENNYTTEDILYYISGEGSANWRDDMHVAITSDGKMLKDYRNMRKWDLLLSKIAKIKRSPSMQALQNVKDYARQQLVVSLC